MKVRRRADLIRVQLADSEAHLLAGLIDDFATMLSQAEASDPAMQRLYPDGYTDDDEASAEFRELVAADLTTARAGRLRACRAELPDGSGTISLDDEAADRWLRVLNDLRLTLGVRLGHHRGGRAGLRRSGGQHLPLAERRAGSAGQPTDGIAARKGRRLRPGGQPGADLCAPEPGGYRG